MKSNLIVATLLFTWLVVPAFSEQHSITLHIDVVGATPGKGQIILSLFSTADNYLKTPILSRNKPVNAKGAADFELNDLPPGRYAVNVVYDEDSNGQLNTGLFGIPVELVGFSNNAKGIFGPPKFDKVVFEASETLQLSINLGRAKD